MENVGTRNQFCLKIAINDFSFFINNIKNENCCSERTKMNCWKFLIKIYASWRSLKRLCCLFCLESELPLWEMEKCFGLRRDDWTMKRATSRSWKHSKELAWKVNKLFKEISFFWVFQASLLAYQKHEPVGSSTCYGTRKSIFHELPYCF